MNTANLSKILDEIINFIDIPDSAYEDAERRYNDLGQWLLRPGSKTSTFAPEIRPQGSFRIGTVNRPLSGRDGYDLDLSCRLNAGITKSLCTQRQLKNLVGREVEDYRHAHNIERKLEEKHRCWRLLYSDETSFHMDIVPSIPEDETTRAKNMESMIAFGIERPLATSVSGNNSAITDNTLMNYDIIDPNWSVSNAEGFALWFEARMKQAKAMLESRAFSARVASIDKLKPYHWKSPLQKVVQLLKWHRDIHFTCYPDLKPVSIILTTLAAMAYQGEEAIDATLEIILPKMPQLIRVQNPRVPNPVNPDEDFAHKWPKDPRLEDNFFTWLQQAQRDLQFLKTCNDPKQLRDYIIRQFGIQFNEASLRTLLGVSAPAIVTTPKTYEISGYPARPWRR